MAVRHKSVETKFMEQRDSVLRGLRRLDRRSFLKVAAASAGAVLAKGLMPPHTFQIIDFANAATDKSFGMVGKPGSTPFRIAYISDSHLYERTLNQRFVRGIVRAVQDVNAQQYVKLNSGQETTPPFAWYYPSIEGDFVIL